MMSTLSRILKNGISRFVHVRIMQKETMQPEQHVIPTIFSDKFQEQCDPENPSEKCDCPECITKMSDLNKVDRELPNQDKKIKDELQESSTDNTNLTRCSVGKTNSYIPQRFGQSVVLKNENGVDEIFSNEPANNCNRQMCMIMPHTFHPQPQCTMETNSFLNAQSSCYSPHARVICHESMKDYKKKMPNKVQIHQPIHLKKQDNCLSCLRLHDPHCILNLQNNRRIQTGQNRKYRSHNAMLFPTFINQHLPGSTSFNDNGFPNPDLFSRTMTENPVFRNFLCNYCTHDKQSEVCPFCNLSANETVAVDITLVCKRCNQVLDSESINCAKCMRSEQFSLNNNSNEGTNYVKYTVAPLIIGGAIAVNVLLNQKKERVSNAALEEPLVNTEEFKTEISKPAPVIERMEDLKHDVSQPAAIIETQKVEVEMFPEVVMTTQEVVLPPSYWHCTRTRCERNTRMDDN